MLPMLSLLPLLTTGQAFGSVILSVSERRDITINAENCGTTLGGQWLPLLTGQLCSGLTLWVTDRECRDTFADGDLVLPEVALVAVLDKLGVSFDGGVGGFGGVPSERVVRIPVDELPLFAESRADGGMGCGVLGLEQNFRFCSAISMSLDLACVSQTIVRGRFATIRYDTKPPAPPDVTAVEPLDSSISVHYTADGDTDTVIVQVKGPQDEGFNDLETKTRSAGIATVDGLANGTTYLVQLVGVDLAGNVSAPSAVSEVTPRASMGFWGACRAAGCPATNTCSAAGGPVGLAGLSWLLLAVGRGARRSREASSRCGATFSPPRC